MRRLRRIALVLIAVVVVLVAWEPSRVAVQTGVLLPNLLDAGPKPLNLFSEAPARTSVPYRTVEAGSDPELAELWLPSWASAERPAGAMLLVFGVNNLGRNHPSIERVADGLARTGVAVLVPDSRTLLEGRLEAAEIDGVVRAYQLLAGRPEVDPDRVGIVGFSVGGSLALLAAADERIASSVRWVNAFGAFADASSYLASVAAHAYRRDDGMPVPWTPTPLAREVYFEFVLSVADDPDDRNALRDSLGDSVESGERPSRDESVHASLADDSGRAAYELLTAVDLEDAERAVADLPPDALRFIDAISPVRHLGGIRSHVHLMHETEDHHVPYVETRALADALARGDRLTAHTEFRLFDHVQPDDLDLVAAAPQLVKLLLHVRTLLEATL